MPEHPTTERSHLGTVYDRTIRGLIGIPDVTKTKPTTIRTVHPILELVQTFIVQTYRHKEQGDTISIEYMDAEGSYRIALPPSVCEAIARQRDGATSMNRKKAAKAEAARRKAHGILPGFLKKKTG
jgi:hypothetical protein